MTRSTMLSRQLDLLVDDFDDEPRDWARLLADAGLRAEERRARRVFDLASLPLRSARRRRPLRLVAAVVAIGATAFIALLIAPSGGNECARSVVACAAAAIHGPGPIVHMAYTHDGLQFEIWYDTERSLQYEVVTALVTGERSEAWVGPFGIYSKSRGRLRKVSDTPPAADEHPSRWVVEFFGSYEEKLEDGTATLHGEGQFRGSDVYLIDFPVGGPLNPVTGRRSRVTQRVAVDRRTFQPLGWGLAAHDDCDHCGGRDRMIPFNGGPAWFVIESAALEPRDPAMFEVPLG